MPIVLFFLFLFAIACYHWFMTEDRRFTRYKRPMGESTLITYSFAWGNQRTSIRLERTMNAALSKVAEHHGLSRNQYAKRVARHHNRGTFASAMRAQIVKDLADMAGLTLE